MGIENNKTEVLLKRLCDYDTKYREQMIGYNTVPFGYGMRAYHRLKTMNPPHWKTREKASEIKQELEKRNVKFKTYWV